MTGLSRKSINAKAQERDGASRFKPKDNGDADSDSETSDEDWLDDEGEDEIDLKDACNEMASLYSFFLPRHLRPKTAVFHDEKKVRCMTE
jgi:hypothetical protein